MNSWQSSDPSAAVISCGAVNRFGHPNKEVMDSLEKRIGSSNVSVTATQGNIEFTTDGQRLWRQVDNRVQVNKPG